MATVNKASLRSEFDALNARFESLCAEGKMSADADGAVSPARAAAPAEDPRSGLTRRRRWRDPAPPPVPGCNATNPPATRLPESRYRRTGIGEPRGLYRVNGVDRRGLLGRFGTDDAVAARGVVFDASLAHEFAEDGGEGGVAGGVRGARRRLRLRRAGDGTRSPSSPANYPSPLLANRSHSLNVLRIRLCRALNSF